MKTLHLPRILLLLLAALCLDAQAQGTIYTLEMVVFEQPADGDSENLAAEAGGAPDAPAFLLNSGGHGVTVLPGREGKLVPAVYTLNRRGARVLFHLRWRQAIPRSRHNPWFAIRGKDLEGRIRINRGRYLHLYTDLRLLQGGQGIRMREKTRLRSGKLYYVDHPRLGVLFLASRWHDPNAPAQATPATPAPGPAQPEQKQPEPDNPPEQRKPAGELPRATPDNS